MDVPQEAPTFNAHEASQSPLLARRHRSLPSRTAHSESVSSVGPTSPEVINSLITSLSTISAPVQSHFDSVPPVESHTEPPPLDSAVCGDSSDPASLDDHGFRVSYGTSKKFVDEPSESPFLHPDDAAAAPIIRMARAPPSPKTLKSKPSFSADTSPARPTSRASYASSHAAYEGDSVFGMITSEPGPRHSTAASIASSSSGGRRSLKGSTDLLKRSSREFANDKPKLVDRLRKRSSYNDSLKHNNVPRNRTSLRSMRSMADLAEEGRSGNFTMESLHETNTARDDPSHEHRRPSTNTESLNNSPINIANGKVIPTRESSLRHDHSSNSKRHRSSRHSRYSSRGSNHSEAGGKGVLGSPNEVEKVTQRIKELKDQQQKIKNEREMGPSSPRSTKTAPVKQTRSSFQSKDEIIDWEYLLQNGVNGPNRASVDEPISEESAPAPAVMTGKSRAQSRSSNGPPGASSKPTDSHNLVTQFPLEKPDHHAEKRSPRHSQERTTSRHHRRLPSIQASPSHASTSDGRPSSADSIDKEVFDCLSSPKLTQKVSHPTTGRTIAFSEVGDPKGHVVLCCLGMGLTRYLMAFYDELARTLHLRLVTLDRPGVGESGPYIDEPGTPLTWTDDVAIVCNHLKVTKFSILAHSAGAIYALATALRIPQHIRGRIHLLAPWIPPSQLSSIGAQKAPAPSNAVPYSQRILRTLPPSILKVANASFLTATSASITTNLPKSSRRNKRRISGKEYPCTSTTAVKSDGSRNLEEGESEAWSKGNASRTSQTATKRPPAASNNSTVNTEEPRREASANVLRNHGRQLDYDMRLTYKTWELATTNANPAVDLLVCLERRQEIGFRYVDISRPVVIHHGSRDARVPADNVRWLGKMMRRCEVRILDGEGHGLMASAAVMSSVLMEMAKEWDDWTKLVQGKRKATVNHSAHSGVMLQQSS